MKTRVLVMRMFRDVCMLWETRAKKSFVSIYIIHYDTYPMLCCLLWSVLASFSYSRSS